MKCVGRRERVKYADYKLIDRAPWDRDPNHGKTLATRHPEFMFSIRGCSCVMHRIDRIELDWYALVSMSHVRRLRVPFYTVYTKCGNFFPLAWDTARTCAVPSPDAVPCGRCNGEVPPFGKHGWAKKAGLKRTDAHVKLGCKSAP